MASSSAKARHRSGRWFGRGWDLFINARSARLRQRRAPQGKSSGAGAKPEQPVCEQVHGVGEGCRRPYARFYAASKSSALRRCCAQSAQKRHLAKFEALKCPLSSFLFSGRVFGWGRFRRFSRISSIRFVSACPLFPRNACHGAGAHFALDGMICGGRFMARFARARFAPVS